MNMFANLLLATGGELLERLQGPLNFRLIVMPIVVSVLAIRAGLRDAREGRPSFLYGLATSPSERPGLLSSALADVGKIFIVAVVLDTIYQIMTSQSFHAWEVLIVAVACAIAPYVVLRGSVALLARRRSIKHSKTGEGEIR